MSTVSDKKSLLIISAVFASVICLTYLISVVARGYQINLQNNSGSLFKATGLLSATSKPKSASVYVNDKLITATDDTINLAPGDYQVKIVKDGYLPWEKSFHIKKETVYQTDTNLFRSVSDLKSLTSSGALHSSISPDYSKVIYAVASASASHDNGLYLIELTDNPLPIGRNIPRQIATNFTSVDWSQFNFTFSPNSRQILASNQTGTVNYLLSLDTPITATNLSDATSRLSIIKTEWRQQSSQIITTKTDKLPSDLRQLISTSSATLSFNSSEDKVLYLAISDGNIKDNIITPPPAQSNQPQSRQLTKGNYYVYDIKDDTNFLIGPESALLSPFWLANSNNIAFVENKAIKVVEYDGTNKQTIYAGNFDPNAVYPWADGSRIIALISPFTSAPANLYAIIIR